VNLLLSCPVCFGDPSSPMTQSAKWGVLFLLVVVVCVLAAIAGVALSWARRARALASREARAEESSSNRGSLGSAEAV
jgi:predicted small integral membrane protein